MYLDNIVFFLGIWYLDIIKVFFKYSRVSVEEESFWWY